MRTKLLICLRWSLFLMILASSLFLMINAAGGDSMVADEAASIAGLNSFLAKVQLSEILSFDQLLFWSRLAVILLTIILIGLIYFWSAQLIGRWWALLPAFLFALSPTVLAHGHYLTFDMVSALAIFLAVYCFLNFLSVNSFKNLSLAGLTFGFAQLVKPSALILIPYFLIIAAFFVFSSKQKFIYYLRSIFFVFFIGFIIVYLFYLSAGWDYPLETLKNQFLRPFSQYQLFLSRSFDDFLTAGGGLFHYPLVFLLKEPIPAVILALFALIFGLWGIIKTFFRSIFQRAPIFSDLLKINFPEFSMVVFIILYWLTGAKVSASIGMLYLLPALPFIYILSGRAAKQWLGTPQIGPIGDIYLLEFSIFAKNIFIFSVKSFIFSICLILYLLSSLLASPYFVSYFNLINKIQKNPYYQYSAGANFDWGQDLKRLAEWAKNNISPEEKIAVDYFGVADSNYYLGSQAEIWNSAKGSPMEFGIRWLAVSASVLNKATGELPAGEQRSPHEEYRWLKDTDKPFAKAGKTIFIYKLE